MYVIFPAEEVVYLTYGLRSQKRVHPRPTLDNLPEPAVPIATRPGPDPALATTAQRPATAALPVESEGPIGSPGAPSPDLPRPASAASSGASKRPPSDKKPKLKFPPLLSRPNPDFGKVSRIRTDDEFERPVPLASPAFSRTAIFDRDFDALFEVSGAPEYGANVRVTAPPSPAPDEPRPDGPAPPRPALDPASSPCSARHAFFEPETQAPAPPRGPPSAGPSEVPSGRFSPTLSDASHNSKKKEKGKEKKSKLKFLTLSRQNPDFGKVARSPATHDFDQPAPLATPAFSRKNIFDRDFEALFEVAHEPEFCSNVRLSAPPLSMPDFSEETETSVPWNSTLEAEDSKQKKVSFFARRASSVPRQSRTPGKTKMAAPSGGDGVLKDLTNPALNEHLKNHNAVTFKLVKTGKCIFNTSLLEIISDFSLS